MRQRRQVAGLLTTVLVLATISPAQAADHEFDCVIEPWQTVKLSSSVTGVIATVDVERGDFVSKGQVVARLQDAVERAGLALARAKAENDATVKSNRAKAEFLGRKYDRLAQLQQRQVASTQDTEEAFANARAAEESVREAEIGRQLAQLEVNQAEALVEQRTLRSPLEGIVTEVLLRPGEFRNDQSPIMTLAQIDPLRVEAFLPTAYYKQIHLAAQAEIRPEEPIGGSYPARVTIVDHVFDAASGTFGVRLELANVRHELPAGVRCKLTFPGVVHSASATADSQIDRQ